MKQLRCLYFAFDLLVKKNTQRARATQQKNERNKVAGFGKSNVLFATHTVRLLVTGGANSKKICFGRTAKFIRESEDIAGNREPREIIRETANNIGILHNIFGACI